MQKHTFIPASGAGRRDIAILLVGTAQEFDVSARNVLPTPSGFWVSEILADILVDEGVLTEDGEYKGPKKAAKKKTSGNRAAKNTATQKEE